jgi:hypothetical protein
LGAEGSSESPDGEDLRELLAIENTFCNKRVVPSLIKENLICHCVLCNRGRRVKKFLEHELAIPENIITQFLKRNNQIRFVNAVRSFNRAARQSDSKCHRAVEASHCETDGEVFNSDHMVLQEIKLSLKR